jgi:hypothetical protein
LTRQKKNIDLLGGTKSAGSSGALFNPIHAISGWGSYFNTLILSHFIVCIYREFASETSGDTAAKTKKEKREPVDCTCLSTVQVDVFSAAAVVVVVVIWVHMEKRGKNLTMLGMGGLYLEVMDNIEVGASMSLSIKLSGKRV